jgi:flavodoxin
MNAYSELVIFYFSGTGNAKQVAGWFSEFAEKRNIASGIYDISKIEMGALEPINNNSLIIIISPVHGFNYPKITLDFIRRFPSG